MERTEIIGAYLAEELMQKGLNSVNSEKAIHVVTPISNVNRNLMFNNNMQKLIYNRNIILLVSSVSSGITLNIALECLSYYGGVLTGISALFNANPKNRNMRLIPFSPMRMSRTISFIILPNVPCAIRDRNWMPLLFMMVISRFNNSKVQIFKEKQGTVNPVP